MSSSYTHATADFTNIVDFFRFGLSKAHEKNIYYGHGTETAWDEFLALILESLSLPLNCDRLLLQARLTVEEKQLLNDRLFKRIEERVPVPYLTNKAYFCDLSFFVDERVLIPRSPIAELIRQQFSPWLNPDKVEKILDLCTGSGCIAIACSYAFPDALIDAADISPEALQVAIINRERHGLHDILTLIESDCWDKIPANKYNLIVANPPYVSREEMQALPAEYYKEPNLALEAEKNGLAIIEKILTIAHRYLTEEGILVVEVGNSESALIKAYPELPFNWLEFENGGQGVFLLSQPQLQDYFERR